MQNNEWEAQIGVHQLSPDWWIGEQGECQRELHVFWIQLGSNELKRHALISHGAAADGLHLVNREHAARWECMKGWRGHKKVSATESNGVRSCLLKRGSY